MQKRITRERRFRYILPIVALAALVVGLATIAFKDRFEALTERSVLAQHFAPTWHSLNKVFNLSHISVWTQPTTLDVYELSIEPSKLEQLIQQLPFDRDTGTFTATTTGTSFSVPAIFISSTHDYNEKIKISFYSSEPANWSSEKKAFHINFPDSNFFNGAAQMNLTLPENGNYFIEPFNIYRAKKLGLLPNESKFIRLTVNKRDFGVYLATEPWSPEFLAHTGNFYDTDTIVTKHADEPWKTLTLHNKHSLDGTKTLDALLTTPDSEFEQKLPTLLDMEKFYKWQLLYALAGNNSKATAMVFKKETGKYEMLPSNVGIKPPQTDNYRNESLLVRRILSNKKFFDDYQQTVIAYVADEKNLSDDLDYYDQLDRAYTEEFYNDQAKKDNDYNFTTKTEAYKTQIIKNFTNLRTLVESQRMVPPVAVAALSRSEATHIGSFKNFDDRFKSIDQFISVHPEFKKTTDATLTLPAGTHSFHTTVIIPEGLALIIEPGAQLLFAPKTSLISYSPVRAEGNSKTGIYIGPLLPQSDVPWGSFAVTYSGAQKNIFRHVRVNKGGSDTINGIPLDAQFTLHNTTTEITDSVFENAVSHDSLHVTAGSISILRCTFKNNLFDGVDLEHVSHSSIEDSLFINDRAAKNVGDAIDLATSENIVISNNMIINFSDKGISVGEHSIDILIKNLLVMQGGTGLAVKEDSHATIKDSVLINNKTGIDLYRQKQEYLRGGSANADNIVLWNNDKQISVDSVSTLTISNSAVEGGTSGENIMVNKPDLLKLIPQNIRQYITTPL